MATSLEIVDFVQADASTAVLAGQDRSVRSRWQRSEDTRLLEILEPEPIGCELGGLRRVILQLSFVAKSAPCLRSSLYLLFAKQSNQKQNLSYQTVAGCSLEFQAHMKTKLSAVVLAVTLVGLTVASAADEKKKAGNYPALVAASEIKGTNVKNLQNQDLGKIEEVLIQPDSGQVRFVVVEVGGFLGLGATRVAVPWTAFQLSKEGNKPKWVLDADKEKLKNAPTVEGKNYERLYTRADAEPVFVYWSIVWVEPSPSP